MADMENHKKVLERLGKLIEEELGCAAVISPDNSVWRTDLEQTRKKTGEKFTVLIMGIFSSGKSSMINALVGEELLPTGFLPETAVLGELHYGSEKKITLFPKKGKWEGGDEPFDLENPTSEEISKYASIDNEAGINLKEEESNTIDSKFEKMVIQWPLELLKDGVVLVDSPGINDPYNNDYITRSYLPTADAIIYVMNAQHAYEKGDITQLNEINSLGLRNIIVAYPFFDIIAMQSSPSKVEQFRKVLTGHALKHEDLGEEAIHFLSSLEGLKAKMNHDQSLLIHSGYDGLERYLTKYLIENKGRDQVKGMSNAIEHYADVMIKEAETLNRTGALDSSVLEKRIENAKKELEIIKMKSETTESNFRMSMKNCLPVLKEKVEGYVGHIAEQVDLEDFEPETKMVTGLGKMNPVATKKKAKELQNECMAEFSRRMNNAQNRWIANELLPAMIEMEQQCVEDIQMELTDIARQLDNVDIILAEGTVKGKGTGTASSAALGVGYAVLTGDWYTGAMTAVYGKGAMAKRLAIQAGIGLATGTLIAAGITVTFPVFVAAVILGDIVNILSTNTEKQKAKIKKTVVTKSREGFASDEENRRKNVDSIMEKVRTHIDKVCGDMAKAMKTDISQKEKLIQATITESQKEKSEKDGQISKRRNGIVTLNKIKEDTKKICAEYRIAE